MVKNDIYRIFVNTISEHSPIESELPCVYVALEPKHTFRSYGFIANYFSIVFFIYRINTGNQERFYYINYSISVKLLSDIPAKAPSSLFFKLSLLIQ